MGWKIFPSHLGGSRTLGNLGERKGCAELMQEPGIVSHHLSCANDKGPSLGAAWQVFSLAAFAVTSMVQCRPEMADVQRGSEFSVCCWIGACSSRVRPGKRSPHFLFSPSEEVSHIL